MVLREAALGHDRGRWGADARQSRITSRVYAPAKPNVFRRDWFRCRPCWNFLTEACTRGVGLRPLSPHGTGGCEVAGANRRAGVCRRRKSGLEELTRASIRLATGPPPHSARIWGGNCAVQLRLHRKYARVAARDRPSLTKTTERSCRDPPKSAGSPPVLAFIGRFWITLNNDFGREL